MISIIDYGMGNLKSVQNALNYLKIKNQVTNSYEEIVNSKKLILPGVGSFSKAMEELNRHNLIPILKEEITIKKKPILGICLGMQLLSDWGEEGDCKGLGFLPGKVKKFEVGEKKIPHVGFNNVTFKKSNPLFKGINNNSDYYFVHSYHFSTWKTENILGETEYGINFVSSVNFENIYGVQFHPEKSQKNGLKLLNNFNDIKC